MMEVIETIVIQSTEVEGKETVVSSVDVDKTKAGWFMQREVKQVSCKQIAWSEEKPIYGQ